MTGSKPMQSDPPGELQARIRRLARERRGVILVHNYQRPEVQEVADHLGDSLDLSRKAAETDARVIVFCGVHFMAETASLLCPDKLVLLPDRQAGCPMADMITVESLQEFKARHPAAAVVAYINTSAAIKAHSDVVCTSANAIRIVNQMDTDEVIFVPDQYLGHHVSLHSSKTIHLFPGYCPTHQRLLPEEIEAARREHPRALVMAHPECPGPVLALADHVLGTGAMVRLARESAASEFIVATEEGLAHRLRRENPGKVFIVPSARLVCPNMKLTTLEKLLWSLEELKYQVTVPEEYREPARRAIQKMLTLSAAM